jgi:hypothetical protein
MTRDPPWNRCDACGRFIAIKDFIEGDAARKLIYPASEFTIETWETLCHDHNGTPATATAGGRQSNVHPTQKSVHPPRKSVHPK